jgi:hypothetical protein
MPLPCPVSHLLPSSGRGGGIRFPQRIKGSVVSSFREFFISFTIAVTFTSAALAMPPCPELAQKIRNHELPVPYYLAHRAELNQRGVDVSPRIRTVDELMHRALDDNLNLIAILVDFTDHPAITEPTAFDGLLFGEGAGTLRHYYSEVSRGSLTLVTANLPSTLGWQRAPETYAYYVDGQTGFGTYPRNAQ